MWMIIIINIMIIALARLWLRLRKDRKMMEHKLGKIDNYDKLYKCLIMDRKHLLLM